MERSFRDSDILARLGGDEFSVLFVEYNQGLVRRAVARLEKNMNLLNAEGTDLPLLSVSVGIAQFSPDTKPGINELLEQADADMYIQKQQAYESRLQ
jgi:diguanylate cyclase (GGDEF)-like protein